MVTELHSESSTQKKRRVALQTGTLVLVCLVAFGVFMIHQKISRPSAQVYQQTGNSLHAIASTENPEVTAARETVYVKFVQENVIKKIYNVSDELIIAKGLRLQKRFSDADTHISKAKESIDSIEISLSGITTIPPKYKNTQEKLLGGLEDYKEAFNFRTEASSSDKLIFTDDGKRFIAEGNKLIQSVLSASPELDIPDSDK